MRRKAKKPPDTLLIMAVAVLSFVALYGAWCWAALIRWGVQPPEGTSLAVLGTGAMQLLVGGGIQAVKKMGKTVRVKELEAENKALQKRLDAANKQLEKARRAVGQVRMDGG